MVSELLPACHAEKFADLAEAQSGTGGIEMSDIPSQIKRQAMDRDFQPSVRIGKTGVTENIVDEIRGQLKKRKLVKIKINKGCLLYTSPSPRDRQKSRMPSSA